MADDRAKLLAKFIEPLRVKPGSKVKLAKDFDPGYKASFLKKKEGATILQGRCRTCWRSTRRGWPRRTPGGCWFCLQAMDAGGKDGTIRMCCPASTPRACRSRRSRRRARVS